MVQVSRAQTSPNEEAERARKIESRSLNQVGKKIERAAAVWYPATLSAPAAGPAAP